jgi:glycosyltransferase involved in cell wall biosynthesis
MTTFDISVVIPTYNRAAQLQRVLRALERQQMPGDRFEVVVVDDGSPDETTSVLALSYAYSLRSKSQSNGGPASARNRAIRLARGALIVFLDDDVIPEPDLLARHLEAQENGPSVVIGRMMPPGETRQAIWAEWELRGLERQYAQMDAGRWSPTPRQFYTANASVPREALLRAGLFNERFRRAEDVELAYRLQDLGLPFRFDSAATVVHDTPRSLSNWLRIAWEYGEYDVIMWREMGREHILWSMARELRFERHPALRFAARALVGRNRVMRALRWLAPAAIGAAETIAPRRPALAICSAIFNLLYWHGAACELGDRATFWQTIASELGPNPQAVEIAAHE